MLGHHIHWRPTFSSKHDERGPGPTRRLRVFVDRTLVEVFVDGRTAITQEVPAIPADAAVAIVPTGNDRSLAIERLDIWSLAPIW